MKKFVFAVLLMVSSIALAQDLPPVPSIIVPPGATSGLPIAVVGYGIYNATPPVGGKHTTGGVALLFPASEVTAILPKTMYARLSIDVQPIKGCRGCLGTSFRPGVEQILFTAGPLVLDAGAGYGVLVGSSSTTGSLGFDLRIATKPSTKKMFGFFSVGGQQNGSQGVVSKFEAGIGYAFGMIGSKP